MLAIFKRAAVGAGGKEGTPTTIALNIECRPLDPVDPELAIGFDRLGARTILQTFVLASYDIRNGDIMTVGSKSYRVRSVAKWEWLDTEYLHLIIEDIP